LSGDVHESKEGCDIEDIIITVVSADACMIVSVAEYIAAGCDGHTCTVRETVLHCCPAVLEGHEGPALQVARSRDVRALTRSSSSDTRTHSGVVR
jgi:hypothetical protein